MGRKADTQGRGNQAVADSPDEYRFVVEFTDDLVAVVDRDGVYRMVNEAFLKRRGLERTEVVGRKVRDVVGPEAYDKVIGPNLKRCLQGEVVEYEMSHDYPGLGQRHLLVRYSPILGREGEVVRAVSVIRDITDYKQAMISLQESEERFRELVENIEEVFWLTEPGEPERVRYVSPAYERIWGRPVDELYHNPRAWIESVHPEDQPAVRKAFESFLAGQSGFDLEYRIVRPDGSERWIWDRAFRTGDRREQTDSIAGLGQDITWRKQQQQRIHHMAMHDPLTGLPNRNLFTDRFLQAKALAKRSETKLALLYVDLDHFKKVNDSFGHKVGDTVLSEVARRISLCLRDTDTVARFGGDEFVLLMSQVRGRKDVEPVAYRILAALSGPVRHSLGVSRLSGSIGIALYPDLGQDQDALIRAADTALYTVKQSSGNGFLFAG